MPELVASFTLTKQELMHVWRRLQLRRSRAWLCPAIGVMLIVEGFAGGTAVAVWTGCFLAIWSSWSILSYAPRRLWRRLPTLSGPQTITIRESGVEEQLTHLRATTDWEHWTHVVRVDGAWVLRSSNGYTIIPSRSLAGPDADSVLCQLAGSRFAASAGSRSSLRAA
jgi:hypothetical protein